MSLSRAGSDRLSLGVLCHLLEHDPVRESLQSSVGTLTLPPDCKILDVAQPSYRKRLYVLCGTVSTRRSHSHPHTLKLSPLRFSVVLESITGKKSISLSNLILVWTAFFSSVASVSCIIDLVWPAQLKLPPPCPPPALGTVCFGSQLMLPSSACASLQTPSRITEQAGAFVSSSAHLFSLSERSADSRAARGLREGGRGGCGVKRECEDAGGRDQQLIRSLDTRAAVWRAGAHFKTPRLSGSRWVLFVPLLRHSAASPRSLPPPLTSVSSSTSISISLSFLWLLHHLTGVFSRQCSSMRMSQAGLTLL